jgi:hypothetical protein
MFPTKTRKLRLSKETVRQLTGAEMAAIAGGALKLGAPAGNGIVIIATGEKTTSVKCVRAR